MNSLIILPAFPMPPSVNDCYADVANGKFHRRVLTKAARDYKQAASELMNQSGYTTLLREFVEFHGEVDVWFYVRRNNWHCKNGAAQPNKNAGDADNRIKILQDTIFKCIGIDDAYAFFSGSRKMPLSYMQHLEPKYEGSSVVVKFTKMIEEVDEF